MPVQGGIIKQGATSFTVTAGTDLTLSPDGLVIVNGVHLIDAAQADFRIRRSATLKNKVPVLGTDGKYTKDRKEISFTQPKLGADGLVRFPVIRLIRETYWEQTAAEILDMNYIAAQFLFDSDYVSFWTSGSLL